MQYNGGVLKKQPLSLTGQSARLLNGEVPVQIRQGLPNLKIVVLMVVGPTTRTVIRTAEAARVLNSSIRQSAVKHKKRVMCTDPAMGDAYTFVGIDAETKLIITFETGKRDESTTRSFIDRLRQVTTGRFQLTTDGFRQYPPAVDDSFGWNIDYGT